MSNLPTNSLYNQIGNDWIEETVALLGFKHDPEQHARYIETLKHIPALLEPFTYTDALIAYCTYVLGPCGHHKHDEPRLTPPSYKDTDINQDLSHGLPAHYYTAPEPMLPKRGYTLYLSKESYFEVMSSVNLVGTTLKCSPVQSAEYSIPLTLPHNI